MCNSYVQFLSIVTYIYCNLYIFYLYFVFIFKFKNYISSEGLHEKHFWVIVAPS